MTKTLPGRVLGYARVSTRGQDLAYQIGKLKAAGCDEIFHEKQSGRNQKDRPQLARLLKSVRVGDIVLATVTDRIARDPLDLLNIVDTVKRSGGVLKLVDEPFIDTTSEMSDLILFLIGWAARWQRLRILENTANGREDALRRGVKFGRKPKLTSLQQQEIIRRRRNGEKVAALALLMKVSESTVIRIKNIP